MPDPKAQQKDEHKPGHEPLFTARQLKHAGNITGIRNSASREALQISSG